MQTPSNINAFITTIEQALSETIPTDEMMRRYFFSSRQLYREFYIHTGHSVGEYIRKRRISKACERIKSSETPLAIIAEQCGCGTQQAFCKLFKSIVGLTPGEYRQSDSYYYFYPFPMDGISLAVQVGAESIPECEIYSYYDSCLIGIEDRALAQCSAIAAIGGIGRIFGRNSKQIGNRFCYEVMLGTNTAGKTATYATCTVPYREEAINEGWNYLYNIWLSASMFEQAEDGYFEEYLFRNGKPYKLKLYLPVKKCRTAQHIRMVNEPGFAFVTATAKGQNAERRASEAVMAYLRKHFPLLVRNARRFYVGISGDTYTCGVECGEDFTLPVNCGLNITNCPAGDYAALPDDCLGDIRVGADKLTRWLQNSSISHADEPVFAVYETQNHSFDTEKIRMTLYRKIDITIAPKVGKTG